jgi:hypothetical protein
VDRDATLSAIAESLRRPPHRWEAERSELSRRLLPHLKQYYRNWPLPQGEPWYRLNGR